MATEPFARRQQKTCGGRHSSGSVKRTPLRSQRSGPQIGATLHGLPRVQCSPCEVPCHVSNSTVVDGFTRLPPLEGSWGQRGAKRGLDTDIGHRYVKGVKDEELQAGVHL